MANRNREHLYKLTKREIEVLTFMSQAMSNREIGEQLGIGIEAVRHHAKNIYAKLEVSGRQKASLKAQELGLIDIQSSHKSSTSNNLPAVTPYFVGRREELHRLHQLQQSPYRLITILGAGGMGKTQLALAYGHQVRDQYPDGVVFVPLDEVTGLEGMVLQVVDSLHLKLSARADYKQELLNYLADKNMLLIIDSFEHLLNSAVLLADILNVTTDVHLIVTSRERLLLTHETPFQLKGLSYPDTQDEMDTNNFEAIELIQQLAQQIAPERQMDATELPYIIQLCQLTQGMPLGLILAMSWIVVYQLPQIIEEIQKSIDFLQTDMRDIPERHRNIRSVFEWTWRLLSDEEQSLFMKLSVFRNGCTIDAIESIIKVTPHVLQSLVNKALLYRDVNDRYMMHALLRQYGEQKLQHDTQIQIDTHNQHAYYYANIAEQIMSNRLIGDDADIELENLYGAWRWGVAQQDMTLLWQLVNTYGIIAYQLGCALEMKLLYEELLEQRPTFEQLDRNFIGALLFVSSSLNAYTYDHIKRDAYYQDAQAVLGEHDLTQQHLEMIYATYHAVLTVRQRSWDDSLVLLQDVIFALESQPKQDDRIYQTMLVYVYAQKAYIMNSPHLKGQITVKQSALHALQMAKAIQHKHIIGFVLIVLGERALFVGDHHEAYQYFRQIDEVYQGLNSTIDHGGALFYAGLTAYLLDNYDEARLYLRRSLDILQSYGQSLISIFIARIIAHWKYETGDTISAVELITFADEHITESHIGIMVRRYFGQLDFPSDDKQIQYAIDRGKVMDSQSVVRELYIWLED